MFVVENMKKNIFDPVFVSFVAPLAAAGEEDDTSMVISNGALSHLNVISKRLQLFDGDGVEARLALIFA